MELLDLESDGFERVRPSSRNSRRYYLSEGRRSEERSGRCARQFVSLRKYTLPICILEALVIGLFVYLLLFREPPNSSITSAGSVTVLECNENNAQLFNSSLVRVLQLRAGTSLLLDRIAHCDQRRHDFKFGVACSSSRTDACQPVERLEQADARKQRQLPWATVIVTSEAGKRLVRRELELGRHVRDFGRFPELRLKTRLELWPGRTEQRIIGWGGALTDSSIQNILSLTTNGTRRLLDDYFGRDGLMFNLVRITMGGSDFSARFYTNDDAPDEDAQDLELRNFKLREEDLLYKIPLLRMIQQEYEEANHGLKMKLFASMWSPPTWMKTNNHFNKGYLRGSINDEALVAGQVPQSERFYDALARLKVALLKAYQREGVHFWGLTVMNEPQFAVQPFLNFNTMIFPAQDYANYVAKYLGPQLKSQPSLEGLKLMAHDDNRRFLVNYSWPILDQKRVRQFIDGVSVHGYVDEDYEMMSATLERFAPEEKGFFVLPTELCSGHLPFMASALVGNWHRGVHYALDIIRSLQHAAAGWVDWNMALDTAGGPGWLGGKLDAAVIVDKARDLYYKSPMFYVMGHFSRYIPPGSLKVRARLVNAIYDHQLEAVVFRRPDGQLASVVLNNNPYPVEVYLSVEFEDNLPASTFYYALSCEAASITTVIFSEPK